MNSKHTQQRGFTLTEVLVAVAIFAIIFVAALLIYDKSNRVFKESVESSDAQQHTRAAFDRLSADVRMMGFDFDRDGVPTTGNREQQPDEQLEYMGDHALTIRGNFNYDMAAANEFGREKDYEPVTGEFSVVTTSNDEIVTYVLKSDNGANGDDIVFYADTRKPRDTFPGGSDEQTVTIPGVNLCVDGCNDPPYTLYRVTLKDADLANPSSADAFNFTPVANNIRSLEFTYYSSVPALDDDIVTPNLGAGQYKISGANAEADVAARVLRGTVKAVRVKIVGMTSSLVSGTFQDPVEMSNETPHPTARRYRQYPLEAVIQPRNVGVRGMEEFDVTAPQKPTITSVCVGSCGIVRVEWNPPAAGTVDSYTVFWDTSATGNCSTCAFANNSSVGSQTYFYASVPDPSKTWYFTVIASNSFGSSEPSNESAGVVPINHTKPMPPAMISATGNPDGPAAVPNDITVRWQLSNEIDGAANDSCGNPITESPSFTESSGFRVYRSTNSGFDPATDTETVKVFEGQKGTTGAPSVDEGSGLVTYVDKTAKLACTPYYYRVQILERCDTTALNLGGDAELGVSDLSGEIEGRTVPASPPRRPINLVVAKDEPYVDPITGEETGATVTLAWDEVVQDTGDPDATPDPVSPAPILVQNYIVERTDPDGKIFTWDVTLDENVGDGTVTDTETIVPAPDPTAPHVYRVKAVVCNGEAGQLESEWSDEVKYPCSQMNIAPFGIPPLDGSGQADDPYVIGDTLELEITTTKAIAAITATMGGEPLLVTGTDPQLRYVAVTADESKAQAVTISYTDADLCSVTRNVWVIAAPSNCCLAPFKAAGGGDFEPLVITKVAGENVIEVRLVNLCADDLTLDRIKVNFTQTSKTPANKPESWSPRISTIEFPEQGGGFFPHNFGGVGANDGNEPPQNLPAIVAMSSVPSVDTTILGGSNSYTMRLKFTGLKQNETLVAAPTGAASEIYVTGVCIVYDREGDISSTFCKIAQEADSSGCAF